MNEQIKARKVCLIDENGHNEGEVDTKYALDKARENEMDLWQVNDGAVPTCKIVNYGKYIYEQEKRKKKNQSSHKQSSPKGMRTGYSTADHDLQFKHKSVFRFLEQGKKVNYSLVLEGRERDKVGPALKKFNERVDEFSIIAEWGKPSVSHSRGKTTISSTLRPKAKEDK